MLWHQRNNFLASVFTGAAGGGVEERNEVKMGADILLIEDDDALRNTLAELLEAEGCYVARAENGAQALRYLRQNPHPRLILLDLLMPVMDGFEFRERQRREADFADIPVAVISAVSGDYQRENRLGAVAYLPKPFTIENVLLLKERFCNKAA